jgi:hypothetical protein
LWVNRDADFERMMKNSTPELRNKWMEAWMKWMNENKASILEVGPHWAKRSALMLQVFQTRRTTSAATLACKQKRMTRRRNCSAGTTHFQMPGAWVEILEIMPLPGM